MKKIILFLLALTLFSACKEQPKPISPNEWLSQIQDEEAKKRTTDVLEKIYASSAYLVVEKDSLSKIQVQFANCEFVKDKKYASNFVVGILLNRHGNLSNFLNEMYKKDSLVSKAALHVLLDTNIIDLGRYYNLYQNKTQHSIKVEKQPSKKLEKIENELVSYLEVYPRYNSDGRIDSISKVGNLLEKALQEPNSYEYGLPKFVKKNGILVSEDEKFRLYSYKFGHGNSASAYVYLHYRASDSSKSILKEAGSLEMQGIPQLVFQLEDNKYGVFYNHGVGGMDWHVLVQVYEIKNDKIVLCKDCVEGEATKYYIKQTRGNIFPVYDSAKKELSFDKSMFRGFGNLPYWSEYGKSMKQPITENKSKRGTERINMERRILKWNGETLTSSLSKLYYCQE